nr:LysR substrate-binding domain-containing protein [Sinorhizobium meliloti]
MRQRVLIRDKLLVIARKGHHSKENRCRLAYSCQLSLGVSYRAPAARRPRRRVERENITVCGSVILLKAVVANSDHLAVLPVHAVNDELAEGRLCSIPIDAAALDRNIALYFREGHQMDEASWDMIDRDHREGRAGDLPERLGHAVVRPQRHGNTKQPVAVSKPCGCVARMTSRPMGQLIIFLFAERDPKIADQRLPNSLVILPAFFKGHGIACRHA